MLSNKVFRMLCRKATHSMFNRIIKRNLLSSQFPCTESWNKRLETPIFKKVSLEDFYLELENNFNQTDRINAIDVDIFTNAAVNETHIDEMQDIVHKFRLSSEAGRILPSTHHGFIRNCLDLKKYDELLRVLNDRLNYGIFPDNYCSILMLDQFIKENDFKNAAKVAVLQMLQEDFSNPLVLYMSLYSCHKYLLNPTDWEVLESKETEESDEEIKVRVKYIRNPYFDEHFDLKDSYQLIGKTFLTIGELLNNDIGKIYVLLGSILFNKLPSAKLLLESFIGNEHSISKDVYIIVNSFFIEKKEKCIENEKLVKEIEDVQFLLKKIESSVADDILPLVEKQLTDVIKTHEEEIIKQQQEIYDEWIETRDRCLNEALEKRKIELRLEEVKKAKENLVKKEQELFFFDKEDEIDIQIENKKVRYPKKWLGKKKKKRSVSEEYVPPEITKQKNLG